MDVKKVIKEKGFTIEQVAKKMGITRITLMQSLSRNPTINTLQRIAKVLDVSVGEFFMDEMNITDTTPRCPHCGKPIVINLSK